MFSRVWLFVYFNNWTRATGFQEDWTKAIHWSHASVKFSSECEMCQLVGYDKHFVERKLPTQYENTFRAVIASCKNEKNNYAVAWVLKIKPFENRQSPTRKNDKSSRFICSLREARCKYWCKKNLWILMETIVSQLKWRNFNAYGPLYHIVHVFMSQLMTADGITFACRGEAVMACGNSTKMGHYIFTPGIYIKDTQ